MQYPCAMTPLSPEGPEFQPSMPKWQIEVHCLTASSENRISPIHTDGVTTELFLHQNPCRIPH